MKRITIGLTILFAVVLALTLAILLRNGKGNFAATSSNQAVATPSATPKACCVTMTPSSTPTPTVNHALPQSGQSTTVVNNNASQPQTTQTPAPTATPQPTPSNSGINIPLPNLNILWH